MEAFNQRPRFRLSEPALRLFEPLVPHADRQCSALPGSIARLSKLFTKDRGELSVRYLDDPALAAGYAAYFLPVNFSKLQMVLSELPEDWAHKSDLSVLDIGSGPGTASLAVRDWIQTYAVSSSTTVRVTAIDHSKAALLEAARLWRTYSQLVGGETDQLVCLAKRLEEDAKWEAAVSLAHGSPFNLIIVANSLNELFCHSADILGRRVKFVTRLLSVLEPDGALIIVEPALRSTARALEQIRDRLLQEGLCSVYSPCLHEEGCPALVKADDWCHEERPWVPPPWIVGLDAKLGFNKDALKFSYLVLRKDGRTIVSRHPNLYRMVSELRVFKGEKRAWLCNGQGRSEVGRLDRKASQANAHFDVSHRGALVHIDRIVRKERDGLPSQLGRIGEDSVVKIVRGA